jgi:hypothetical protein
MARPIEKDGVVFRREGAKFLWMRYRDKDGVYRRESTFTEDRQEALRKLRPRLDARDQNVLEIVRRGESFSFGQWVDTFMENYSKPPYRTQKTHVANLRAVKVGTAAHRTPCSRALAQCRPRHHGNWAPRLQRVDAG